VRMAKNANVLVSYRTYPHIDGYERAVQAAALVQAAMDGTKTPRCLLVQPAMLEQRSNLVAAYVIMAARRGIGNMPPVPRGEVGDADLKQIADYLAAGPHGGAK